MFHIINVFTSFETRLKICPCWGGKKLTDYCRVNKTWNRQKCNGLSLSVEFTCFPQFANCVVALSPGYSLIKSQTQPSLIKYLNLYFCITSWTSEISPKMLSFEMYCHCHVNAVAGTNKLYDSDWYYLLFHIKE